MYVANLFIILFGRPPAVEPLHFILHYSVPLPSSLMIFVANDSVLRCFCPPMLCIPVCHACPALSLAVEKSPGLLGEPILLASVYDAMAPGRRVGVLYRSAPA